MRITLFRKLTLILFVMAFTMYGCQDGGQITSTDQEPAEELQAGIIDGQYIVVLSQQKVKL